ncbi:MAG: Uncharacterised protein [Hyphomonas sp. TMED17]|nr:MAG: Uncharacterised protein [Hyphomonas sp. TMED17]
MVRCKLSNHPIEWQSDCLPYIGIGRWRGITRCEGLAHGRGNKLATVDQRAIDVEYCELERHL